MTFFCLRDSASIAPALVVTCDLAEKDTHSQNMTTSVQQLLISKVSLLLFSFQGICVREHALQVLLLQTHFQHKTHCHVMSFFTCIPLKIKTNCGASSLIDFYTAFSAAWLNSFTRYTQLHCNAHLLDQLLIQLLDQFLRSQFLRSSFLIPTQPISTHCMLSFMINFYLLNAQLLDQLLIQFLHSQFLRGQFLRGQFLHDQFLSLWLPFVLTVVVGSQLMSFSPVHSL